MKNGKINLKPFYYAILKNEIKKRQFNGVLEINNYYTSDIIFDMEINLYDGNIEHYIINGTKCNFSICVDSLTYELKRKPYGKKPFYSIAIDGIRLDGLERLI